MLESLFRKKNIQTILDEAARGELEGHSLHRILSVRDLTALGIAAIIGAGIFSTIGKACFDGGPGVIFLFLFTAVACAFSAFCYAEFASRIPVSGSAYTYSYSTFGELVAWIIGWDLIMEYAIGNITVAISWSSNFNSFMMGIGINLPEYLTNSFFNIKKYEALFNAAQVSGSTPDNQLLNAHQLWVNAPHVFGLPLIINLPALAITAFITLLVYIGIKESRTGSNLMVAFKLLVILFVIIAGAFYVQPAHWHPFVPNGFGGIMKGVSAVFFAYIGFDAISTTAEEAKNPQRDLPLSMLYSLVICTVLYVLVALVLTGMVSYTSLNVGDFLASAFNQRGLTRFGGILALSAVVATTAVLLVFQIGQPRIWMSMSRDGLLPPKFAAIHPKYKTPWYSTIIAGLLVGIPALFMDADFVTDLCSIGTLFAFVLVCGGVLILNDQDKKNGTGGQARFKVPYFNSRYLLPVLLLLVCMLIYHYDASILSRFWDPRIDIEGNQVTIGYALLHKLPYYTFGITLIWILVMSIIRQYSIIPVLGLLSCFYLMTELGSTNWLRFGIWLIIGLVVYFGYGYKNSRLASL